MKKIRQELLIELYENGLKNPLLSPIWILKYENVYHRGSFYLKVYLLENTDISKLNEVQFEIKNENNNCLINVDTFNKAESYKNDSVLGCLIKLPIEFENKSFELLIRRLVIDNKVIQFNETDYGVYRLNEDQTEIKKNKYLSKALKNYSIFPSHIEDDKWICTCGKVNSENECNNCKNTIDDLNRLINEKLENLFIRIYVEKNPFKANPKDDINKNLINYFKPLYDYGYSENDVIKFDIDIEKSKIDLLKSKAKNKKLKIIYISLITLILVVFSLFTFIDNQTISDEKAIEIWGDITYIVEREYNLKRIISIYLHIEMKRALVCISEDNTKCIKELVDLDRIKTSSIDFTYQSRKYSLKISNKGELSIVINGQKVDLETR